MKNCISIWQKEDTIRGALHDAIKEKYDKQEWDAEIFSIKPFNNAAVEQFFFFATATSSSGTSSR